MSEPDVETISSAFIQGDVMRRERAIRLVKRALQERRAAVPVSDVLRRSLEAFAREYPHPKGEPATESYVFQMLSWFSSRLKGEAEGVVEEILTDGYMKKDVSREGGVLTDDREVSGRP